MYIVKIGHSWQEISDIIKELGAEAEIAFFLHLCDGARLYDSEGTICVPHACVISRGGDIEQYEKYSKVTLEWFCIAGDVSRLTARYSIDFNVLYYPESHRFITDFFTKFESELANRKEYYRDICEIYLSEFFMHLVREARLSDREVGVDPKIKESLRFLRQSIYLEYYKKWTVDEMAKLINFSPSYLYSVYKALFGISPISDLIDARIEQSKILLYESEMSVNEIAVRVGYSSYSHFIRQFKGRVGISPQKFRQNRLGDKGEG